MNTYSKHIALLACGAVMGFGPVRAAKAAVYDVTNTNSSGAGSLSNALAQAQSDPEAVIDINSSLGVITLTGPLPEIENNLLMIGNGNTISGAGAYRIFFVNAPGDSVQINNLTLSNGVAQGGGGGVGYGGGGGGAGLGGAIFLNAGSLAVTGVSFDGNSAQGGAGGTGFDNYAEVLAGGGGGGGGLDFAGGGAQGVVIGSDYEGAGGGGGALTSAGTSSDGSSNQAGAGGGVHGGAGGPGFGNGASPTLPDGGGGGGGFVITNYSGNGGSGGNGSDFGGGGGAGSGYAGGNSGASGAGGFGGGGGGNAFSLNGNGYAGGQGGFGGGGGGGGDGGYEGNSGTATGAGGQAGFGGGTGASGVTGNGGGGLAAGGAIFARLGSTLTIQDCSFTNDTAIGGSSLANEGSAIGQALFLGADVTYSVSSGTNTLAETIGGGDDTNAQGGFIKAGGGTLAVTAAESYVGDTTVSAGTLEVIDNVLASSLIAIDSDAVLEYNDSNRVLSSSTTYLGNGTLRVDGTGDVIFGPGVINVDFSPGALIDVESGLLTGSSSYGGVWTANEASLNIASNASFNAVEAGPTGTMQIDALTGAGTFLGGYYGTSTVTIGVAGGSGAFSGTLEDNPSSHMAIVKNGGGTEILSGSNTYSGGTAVNDGSLIVNGTLGAGAVTVSGGTLGGAGMIGGPVNIEADGTLAPTGTLTISNTLNLAGNVWVTLNSGTSSAMAGLTSVTYGGTLTITNAGGTLSPGETFTLFSAASSSGNFDIVEGDAGNNLVFNFNPTNGVLSVASTIPTSPTNITYSAHSGALTLNWPANYTGWILQAQTNPPSMGLTTNWVEVAGSDSLDSMTFAISPTHNVFFRLRSP